MDRVSVGALFKNAGSEFQLFATQIIINREKHELFSLIQGTKPIATNLALGRRSCLPCSSLRMLTETWRTVQDTAFVCAGHVPAGLGDLHSCEVGHTIAGCDRSGV